MFHRNLISSLLAGFALLAASSLAQAASQETPAAKVQRSTPSKPTHWSGPDCARCR